MGSEMCIRDRAVGVLSGLSVDRQRSKIRPLEPPVDRPVDRKEQRVLLSVPVDWVGRPAICQVKACTSVHVGRPSQSTDFSPSRLDRSTSQPTKSTRTEVGRPGRSTDVHRRARLFWQEGRSTDPVDRPESSALWKGPGRPGGRPDRESALCILPRSTGRSTDGTTV